MLITNLSNYGFTLIRYKLEDRTEWINDEQVKTSLPAIKPIQDRISEKNLSTWGLP